MKKIIVLLLSLVITTSFFAQSNEKGNIEFKGGIGGPNWIGIGLNSLPQGAEDGQHSLPWMAMGSYYISPKFSLGLMGGSIRAESDKYFVDVNINDSITVSGHLNASIRRTTIALRPDFHLGNSEKWDPYIGGLVGIRASKIKLNAEVSDISAEFINKYFEELGMEFLNFSLLEILELIGFDEYKYSYPFQTLAVGLHFGTRYSITENIGVYAEVGGGLYLLNGGLSVKF